MTQCHSFDSVVRVIDDHADELIALRRDLHRHPELGRVELRTTGLVADRLERAGLTVRRLRGTGLIAEVGAPVPSVRVALRADIDALPISEQTALPYTSKTEGVSHSCGHDVHTAALVGAALALKAIEPLLVASGVGARLVFQPAEELMPGGAEDVVARPHLTQDLTFALAKVVTETPAVLSRRLDPRAAVALVWGAVHAGGAHNVIPASGTAMGTLRMLDATVWEGAGRLLEEVVHAVVAPYGVTADVRIVRGVPPVVNDAACVDVLTAAVTGVGAHVAPTPQSLGGEDFAWYLAHVPGAMARLGTRAPGGTTYDLHRGDLVIDEAAIGVGAKTLAGAVVAVAAAAPTPALPPTG